MKTQNFDAKTWMPVLYAFVYLADFIGLVIGLWYTSYLITGVVYPVKPADQQLLKSWGIESIFIDIVCLEYLLPLVFAIPVTYRLIRKVGKWLLVSTIAFGIAIAFILSLMSSFETSTLINNMVQFPMFGWFVGQTIGKAIALMWKRKSSVKPPVPPQTI
jgi:hypothetical protein